MSFNVYRVNFDLKHLTKLYRIPIEKITEQQNNKMKHFQHVVDIYLLTC